MSKIELMIPPPMKGYRANMGGVDLSDQCYETIRKSKKWWKTLFLYFIDVGIVNSVIIQKSVGGQLSHKTHKILRFNLPKARIIASEMQINPSPGPGRPRKR